MFRTKQDVERRVTEVVERGDASAAFDLFFGNFWESPPEPDYLPESRIWAIIPVELAVKLFDVMMPALPEVFVDNAKVQSLREAYNTLKRQVPDPKWSERLAFLLQTFPGRLRTKRP